MRVSTPHIYNNITEISTQYMKLHELCFQIKIPNIKVLALGNG